MPYSLHYTLLYTLHYSTHYTPTTPSLPVRAAQPQTFFGVLVASLTFKIYSKNEYNLLISPVKPEGPPTPAHFLVLPACLGWFFIKKYKKIAIICKNVLLAVAGSTFLKSGPQHFTSKTSFFGPPSGKKMGHFGHFRPPWNLKIRRQKWI